MPGTIRLHRVLGASPDRVHRAFLDPDAMVERLPPSGFTGKVHGMDARAGGSHRISFTNFTTGSSRPLGGTELTITRGGVPDVIATEAGYPGGRDSLALLAKLVEAEIPDGA